MRQAINMKIDFKLSGLDKNKIETIIHEDDEIKRQSNEKRTIKRVKADFNEGMRVAFMKYSDVYR